MNNINRQLLRRLKDKHTKLATRFQKGIEEGYFQEKTKRKRYTVVERLKHLEKQIQSFSNRTGEKFKVSYKHWAVALALGVVVSTAAQAQKNENGLLENKKGFIEKLKEKRANQKSNGGFSNRTEAQTIFFSKVAQLGYSYSDQIYNGDFDGDGDNDIMYVPAIGGAFLLTNEGGLTFSKGQIILDDLISESIAGDWDGDGDLDLIYESYPSYDLFLFQNDGSGNFTSISATMINVHFGDVQSNFFQGDIDSDGDLDIVQFDRSSYSISPTDTVGFVVAQNNNLSFTGGSPYLATGSGQTKPLALVDLDDDGDLDIPVIHTTNPTNSGAPYYNYIPGVSSFRAFLNDGTGVFTDAGFSIDPELTDSNVNAYAGDIDGDGSIDILWNEFNGYGTQNYPILNDGAGNFTPGAGVPDNLSLNINNSQLYDVNGDSLSDFVSRGNSYDSTLFYAGDGLGGFLFMSKFNGENSVPGDFDNDGDQDFLSIDGNLILKEQQSSFNFVDTPDPLLIISQTYQMQVADVDNDGDIDILQAGSAKATRIWLNDGTGKNFTISQDFPNSSDAEQMELSDLDGDGDVDFAIQQQFDSLYNNYSSIVFFSNTAGTFSQANEIDLFNMDYFRLGDIDGDGDDDIVVLGGNYPTYIKTLSNNGSFSFILLDSIGTPQSGQFEFGDLDGDTDLDIAIAADSYGIQILINNGTGSFSDGGQFVPAGSTFDIENINIDDFDGDGDMDVFASNGSEYGVNSYVFINDGTGNFTDNGQNISAGYIYRSAVADLDNDGDIDIITGGYLSNPKIWVNDGAANFTFDSDVPLFTDEYAQPAFADFDNDGDLDMVYGGFYNPNVVFLNDAVLANPLEADSLALVDFYNATNGASWTDHTNWTTDDVDTWFGVTVAAERVTGLDLNNNNLEGVIPASFNGLNELLSVDLSGNNISEIQTDLSRLTKLTSIDLSDNNLDFADFELIGSLPGLVVGAQTTNDTPQNEEIPVGSPVSLSFVVDGTGNTYQWFKNGNILTDSTRNQIVIESISRENQGIYYCESRNSAVPSLVLTSELKSAFGTASVTGRLLINETDPATSGEMTLLKVTASDGYDTTAVVNINSIGEFSFGSVLLADYIIVGFADTLQHQGALPTYYQTTGRTAFWAEADTLFLANNFNLDLVSVVYTNPVGEEGVFSGFLEEEQDISGGRVEARQRVRGAGVSMRRGRRTSRTSGTGDLAYYVYTDENGDFIITGVEPGEYNVDIQYPGYPMDEESFLDVTIGEGVKDKEVSVAALVDDGVITVRQLIILSTDKETSGLLMYPNPTSELLKIIDKEGRNGLSVDIYDMSGNKLEKLFFDKQTEVNVKSLPIGQYIIKVQDERGDEILTQRILIE